MYCHPVSLTCNFQAEAVQLIEDGKAPSVPQTEDGATYDPMLKKDKVQIDWKMTGEELHNFIRGNDKIPGAWTTINGEVINDYFIMYL